MTPLVILIPGSKTSKHCIPSKVVNAYCRYFGINPEVDHFLNKLTKYLRQNTNCDIEQFEWSGGISEIFSIIPAAKKLAKILNENKDRPEIVIFGKSLGGRIGELAIKYSGNQKNVSKLIFVATPHRLQNINFPKTIKIINIYSDADNYLRFANKVLYLNFKQSKRSNAQNINIPCVRHSEFNKDKPVVLNGRKTTVFDIYRKTII
jgi:hypothetical protein